MRFRVVWGKNSAALQEGLNECLEEELVGCHRNYVGLVERGEQNVTIDMLGRLAKAMGCTVTDLVSDAHV